MIQYGNYFKYVSEKPNMEKALADIGKSIDETMVANSLDIFEAEKLELKTRYVPPLTYYHGTQLNPYPEWDIGWVATFKEGNHEKTI